MNSTNAGICFLAVLLTMASPASTAKQWNITTGNDLWNLYAFDVAENWQGEDAPNAMGDNVKFSGSAVQYIQLPTNAKVSQLIGNGNQRFIGETLTFTSALYPSETPRMNSVWIFADVYTRESSSDKSMWFDLNSYIAGRIFANGSFIPAGGVTYLRCDRYATHDKPLRTDDLQWIGESGQNFHPGNGSVAVYAEGAAASVSTWRLEPGSPYAVCTVANAATTAVGATVTGDGIPSGTFVRRRFDERTRIELSQPATASGEVQLSFAAFNPDVRIHIPSYYRQGQYSSVLRAVKRMDADNLVIEIDNFHTYDGDSNHQYYTLGLATDESAAWKPGTLLLHNVNDGVPNHKWTTDVLRNCHIVLGGTTTGGGTIFTDKRMVGFESSAYTARLTVPTDLTGTITIFTNFVGTLVKDGAGTLAIGLADTVNTGRIDLREGTLNLSRYADGAEPLEFAEITVTADAELILPTCGVKVRKATFENGARIGGTGTLEVGSAKSGTITVADGAYVIYTLGDADAYVTGVEGTDGEVYGHPAFWLDASKPETLVYTEADGNNYVTRWNDWREGETMFCTNMIRRPKYIYDPTDRKNQYVKISRIVGTSLHTNTEALVWSVPLKDVRAIFMVEDPVDGGGEIAGRTERLPHGQYCGTQGGPFYRSPMDNWSKPIVNDLYGTDRVKYGRFFLNGGEVVGYKSGYLGAFQQLVEWHANTNYNANANHHELWLDAFGVNYLNGNGNGNGCNGCMRISEVIVYTNSLTHAQRVRTAQALMRKWFDRDVAYHDVDTVAFSDATAAVFGANEGVTIADGSTYGFARCEEDAQMMKTGKGMLVIDSLKAEGLNVKEGSLVVKTLSLKNTSVPKDKWVHIDAADAESIVANATDTTALERWNSLDPEGGKYYSNLSGTAHIVPNTLNGLPMVDCGVMNGAGAAALRLHPDYIHDNGKSGFISCPYFNTVFIVYGSKGGGNSLLGCWGNGYPYQGLAHAPLGTGWRDLPLFTPRDEVTYSQPLVAWGSEACAAISNGTNIVRLNGEPCDPFTTRFSNGYDLFTGIGLNRKSDTLATYGQGTAYKGGLEYGEVIIYTNRFTLAEAQLVEAYLAKKWFNRDTPGLRTATCGALTIAEGASVSVCDWAAALGPTAYDSGTGALTVDSLAGAGTLNVGEATLTAGGSIVCDAAAPTALTVNGALNLPETVNVVITGDATLLAGNTYDLVTATTLTGGSSFTVTAPTRPRFSYSVRKEGSKITLSVLSPATVLLLR